MSAREAGKGITIDLAANGATSVSVTPGASIVPIQFTMPAPKFDARGNYPKATLIAIHVTTTFDQAASGGSAVNWDMLPVIIDSMQVQIPVIGVSHETSAYTGPIAKHVIEYMSLGYSYYGGARAQIASTDGDTTVDFYVALPFMNNAFYAGLQFCPWVGWLTNMQVSINMAASTALAAFSTGAVTKTPTTVKAWVEAVPTKRLTFPTFSQWRNYNAPAAGSNQALLQNVGQQGGLTCVSPGSRLAAIVELMNVLGLGGASTADNYTSVSCDLLSQPYTTNVDAFLLDFIDNQNGRSGRTRGATATTVMHPMAGNPYTLAATPNTVNAATAMFIPWRSPGRDAEIGKQPKFQGNLTFIRTFTSAVVSGNFPFVTNELRQLSRDSAAQLGLMAGLTPAQIAAAQRDFDGGRPTGDRGSFALPVDVPPR